MEHRGNPRTGPDEKKEASPRGDASFMLVVLLGSLVILSGWRGFGCWPPFESKNQRSRFRPRSTRYDDTDRLTFMCLSSLRLHIGRYCAWENRRRDEAGWGQRRERFAATHPAARGRQDCTCHPLSSPGANTKTTYNHQRNNKLAGLATRARRILYCFDTLVSQTTCVITSCRRLGQLLSREKEFLAAFTFHRD